MTEKFDKDQPPDLSPPIEQEELSLEGKMFLAVRGYSRAINVTKIISACLCIIFAASLFMIVDDLDWITSFGTIDVAEGCWVLAPDYCFIFTANPNENTDDLLFLIAYLYDDLTLLIWYLSFGLIGAGGMAVWGYVKGNSRRKELRKLIRDYVTQSYYFTLSASTHGKDQIDIDFFNIAKGVFPELQREELKNLKKTGKEWEIDSLIIDHVVYEVKAQNKERLQDYEFDICAKTDDGFFVIKEFKEDQVSYEDLHKAVWIAANNIPEKRKDIFRMVCLANSFSKDAIDRHKDLEKSAKRKVPLDLIAVREKGFSVVKISRLHSKD